MAETLSKVLLIRAMRLPSAWMIMRKCQGCLFFES